jgi:hypothetical protein
MEFKESAVLLDQDHNPLRYERDKAWADISVFHPNTQYIDNRPHWLFENGNKNISIKLNDIPIDFPGLILAYKKGEDINKAVPIDIIELKSKTEKGHLALKKGTYEIVVTNKIQSVIFAKVVK